MSDTWKLIVALLAMVVGGLALWSSRPVARPPGVLVPDEPSQLAVNEQPFVFNDAQVAPQAVYDIEARVLSAEHYLMDSGASLAPVDLAVGWGPMSDTAVIQHFRVDQGGRFYTIYPDDNAIDLDTALKHSANMHLIPASVGIERTLKKIKAGNVVHLHGFLVNINRSDGFYWYSSLTRNDTGNGACELMYVQSVEVR